MAFVSVEFVNAMKDIVVLIATKVIHYFYLEREREGRRKREKK
jgi:hypothetical protein